MPNRRDGTSGSASPLIARLERLGGSVVFGQASLLALQLKILWGSWRSWDLPLWDGATHFAYARQVVHAFTFPPLEWCPLFAAYYSMFHAVAWGSHPFAIYYAHRVASIVLVTASLYGFLRFVVPISCAWLMSVYFLAVAVTLTTNYVVHLFVLLPLLAAYRAAASTSVHANACVLGALILAGCVRPEQFLAVAFAVGVLLTSGSAYRAEPTRAWAFLASWVLLPLFTLPLFVFVLRGAPSHVPVRHSWAAWAQSYAQGYQERHPEWVSDFWLKYDEAVERSFAGATSILDAAANNPNEVLAHIVWNLRLLPTELASVFATVSAASFLLIIPIVGLVGVATLVTTERRRPPSHRPSHGWSVRITEKRRLALVVACTWVPVAVVAVYIRPRAAYLMPVLPGALLITSCGLAVLLQRKAMASAIGALLPVLFLVLLVALPSPFAPPARRPVVELVDLLRQVSIAGDYSFLGPSARGLCAYSAPDRCTGIEIARVPSASTDFATLLDKRNVRLIVVENQRRRSLPEAARTFVANLESGSGPTDWQLVARTTEYSVYVRRGRSRLETEGSVGSEVRISYRL